MGEDGDFLFLACADWENMKEDEDSDQEDSQGFHQPKRVIKLQRKLDSSDDEHSLINE